MGAGIGDGCQAISRKCWLAQAELARINGSDEKPPGWARPGGGLVAGPSPAATVNCPAAERPRCSRRLVVTDKETVPLRQSRDRLPQLSRRNLPWARREILRSMYHRLTLG